MIMKIKNLFTKNLFELPDSTFFNSEDWFLFVKDKLAPVLEVQQGKRELFDDIYMDGYRILPDQEIRNNVRNSINVLFLANSWKYKHLFDLYRAEYNPIWNVDGKEVRTLDRTDTGEKAASDTKSGYDETEFLGSEATTRTGNETDGKTGSELLTREGSITESNDGDIQESKTTFDSDVDYDTTKTADTTKSSTQYGVDIDGNSDPYTEETSFVDRTDTHTYNNVADTKSFTNRKDKTTYNSGNSLSEETSGEMKEEETSIRQGNIGVTSTQSLMLQELEVAARFNFIKTITVDIADCISYIY